MAEAITVSGAEAVAADISKWIGGLPDDIQHELLTFEHQLANVLYSKEPYVTGTLAGSVEILPPEVDSFFALALGRGVIYAGWIEFGGTRGREYVPDGRSVWPTSLDAEGQFGRLVNDATQHSIDHFSWHQEQ